MTDASSFTKLVPGFDFLQGLVKNAGSALPGMGQWVAPTLNPEELAKRIEELRTVQFWLEQNARMLATTIQALEVQRMTLSTLKTMNVQMADLRDSLKVPMPGAPGIDKESADSNARPARKPSAKGAPAAVAKSTGPIGPAPAFAGAVDPTQWWNALTKQFTQIAATAMKDSATDAARNLAGAMVKQSIDAASQTMRSAAGASRKAPRASKAGPRKRPTAKAAERGR
jgi:hypothetical protein